MPARSEAPRLTIGLPVYNGETLLPEAIDALLGQSYEDFELVISDNASTDGTGRICREYAERDPRVRYIRQPRNLGLVGNHNFLAGQARGELFKWASHDDLYARDFLRRCVDALDQNPDAVLAHAWCAVIDENRDLIRWSGYPEATASPRVTERFRGMLFDGKGDWTYAVYRTSVLRRTPLHATYHGGERTLITELALHGRLLQVPDWMFFRRDHPGQHQGTRQWSAGYDPRRASRLRNPAIRLYAEYVWGFVAAVRRVPMPRADKRECYRSLARWLVSRALPADQPGLPVSLRQQPVIYLARRLTGLFLSGSAASVPAEPAAARPPDIDLDALVPGREASK